MADQYLTIAVIAESVAMHRRVTACAAQQGQSNPETWTSEQRWGWAAAPGWGEAWDSAVASGIDDPGADPAVITDGQILAQVQAMLGQG